MERKEYAIAIIIVAIIFMPYAVNVIKMYNSETISEESYLGDILMASVGHLQETSKRLLPIESSPTLLENNKEELCSLIDKQMEIERKMLNYGTADFEKDKEFYDGFCSLSKDEQLMFQEIKNSIESNIVSPREQILKYINLRAKKYLWVLEKSGQKFSIEFIESAYDL